MSQDRGDPAGSEEGARSGGRDPAAELTAAFPRLLGASPFLRRSLVSEGLAPDSVTGGDRALAWLIELAREPWTGDRVELLYRRHLQTAVAAGGAAGAAVMSPELISRPGPPSEEEVARALRRTRGQLLCGLLARDGSELATLDEVTGAMTALAEIAVRELLQAIAPDMAARLGVPVDAAGAPQDLLVLAMGKAGSGELNVSSDLDLIFVCGEVAARCRALDGPQIQSGVSEAGPAARVGRETGGQEFFDRLGRRLIAALGEPDDQGFVFRIDMRLRPHGDAGPLVVGIEMLEEYFLREGREWERFAWAKARVISTPVLSDRQRFAAQCAALDAVVQPFVYRKYFDFGAIGAIRELHQRIGAEARRSKKTWRGFLAQAREPTADRPRNVKLGRGGIREIEFLAQTYCIMRGGRDHRLRERGTVATLRTLSRLGLMVPEQALRLIEDYRFLRRLEHALQYRDDAQTHVLPTAAADLQAVAQLLAMASADELMDRYARVSDEVARSFDGLFPVEDQAPAGADASGAVSGRIDADVLQALGFVDAAASADRLRQLLASARLSAMSIPARSAVARLAAQAARLIAAMTQGEPAEGGATADELLLRWIRLIEVIGRRSTYFSLLVEYPRAHERVLRLLATGGWPTEYLLRHPILLDELIDPRPQRFADDRTLDDVEAVPGAAEPYWEPWITEIGEQLDASAGDMERQMNILRDAHHAQVFRLLLADLGGELRLEALADHLSALADAVLKLALRGAWRSLESGRPELAPGDVPRLAVIAYGKLGGRELGYASDLDLAFVFEEGNDPQAVERNTVLCTQLVRRLLTWLTSVTSSGVLFEIDLRLRPNGNAGLLVTPIAAFERYQTNADGHGAWVWEHQALTRARACAGDPGAGRPGRTHPCARS